MEAVDTAVAAPLKMRMLSPLKIWKPLKIAAEATITEATAVATEAHGEDTVETDTAVAAPFKKLLTPLKIWKWLNITTKATTEAIAAAETTEAAAVMADPAADMATRDTVVVVINTKKAANKLQTFYADS